LHRYAALSNTAARRTYDPPGGRSTPPRSRKRRLGSLTCRNAHIEVLDQANGTRPVHGESQDHISVYEVTAAPGG